MIKIPLKMNRHKKNQIEIKIDNFSQKGLSSSNEILRSTFSMLKKKSTVVGCFWFSTSGSPTWPKFKTHKIFARTFFIYKYI